MEIERADGAWFHQKVKKKVQVVNEESTGMEFIPLYVGILVLIIFYYAFKKSLKAKNEYYQKILPVAQEKIIKAINVIERKQAQKQA